MGFRDLKCRNGAQNRNLREKLSKTGPVENFWLWSKSTARVNGQRITCADVAVWRHLGLTWQEEKRSRHVGRVRERGLACEGRVRRVVGTDGAWSACSWGRNFRGRVWCVFWQFLVGFCSGLSVLSLNAFAFTVGWAERRDPRVAGIVGVTAVTRFWQWLLDEGKGSGRTPEMSTGTRKSEDWLWYHVKNIKCEKDWIVCILMYIK